MIFIIICANVYYQGKHKRAIIDRIHIELAPAESIHELRNRANIIYEAWCSVNRESFPQTWHYLRGEF